MTLVQIVPRLPPATDGLGDYALGLARQLRLSFGTETRFVVCDSSWAGGEQVEGFGVSRLNARASDELLRALPRDRQAAVLLHYVGYGYARRGAPAWLVGGLEGWRGRAEGARLLTMFHEVYARGPVWTSSFWLSPLQRRLAARLAQLSDACLTSRQGYARILRALGGDRRGSILALPVFSNVGEPERVPPPLRDRARRLVVFGSRASRLRVYQKSLPALERACRALAVAEVLDVGPPTGLSFSVVGGVPVVQMGRTHAAAVSRLLADAVAGFFDYDTAFLAKSTIFAAYAAHGVIPVSASLHAPGRADGLEAGKHFWTAGGRGETLSLAEGQRIADSAYEWYQAHNLSEHVKTFAAEIADARRAAP